MRMSGLARKSTHAKGGKKRRAAIENVKCPVGVVGEPSEVTFGPKNRSMAHRLCAISFLKTFIIIFVQQEYEIAQLGPIYVEWKKCKKRNEMGKIVSVSG